MTIFLTKNHSKLILKCCHCCQMLSNKSSSKNNINPILPIIKSSKFSFNTKKKELADVIVRDSIAIITSTIAYWLLLKTRAVATFKL